MNALPPKLTWGRGFFRAWVVLSVLWIGLAVYTNEPKTYSRLWRSVYEVEGPDERRAEFNLSKSPTELGADLAAWLQARRPDVESVELLKDRDQLLAHLKATHQENTNKAASALRLTIVPPLALLGFGLCIFWIGRGFRARR